MLKFIFYICDEESDRQTVKHKVSFVNFFVFTKENVLKFAKGCEKKFMEKGAENVKYERRKKHCMYLK